MKIQTMLHNNAYQTCTFPIFIAKMNHISKMPILAFVYLSVHYGLNNLLMTIYYTHNICCFAGTAL